MKLFSVLRWLFSVLGVVVCSPGGGCLQFWCGGVFSVLVRLGFLVLGKVVCNHVVFFHSWGGGCFQSWGGHSEALLTVLHG